MKKVVGFVLVFILVFASASGALAGSRPKITKQPETVTVKAGGTASFTIKTKGTVNVIIWHFTDPVTGQTYPGGSLSKAVKGLKVLNPNKSTITLSKVPESMHGWIVYAHVNGNGYKIDSDQVKLLIAGMDVPAEELQDKTPSADSTLPEDGSAGEVSAQEPPVEDVPAADAVRDAGYAGAPEAGETGVSGRDQQAGAFTVSATSEILKRVDDTGSVTDDLPVDSLQFEGSGNVLVISDDPIVSWTLNGICVIPDQPVKEFMITDITSDLVIDIKVK